MKNEDIIKDFGSWNVPTSWNDITLKIYEEIERYYEGKDEKFDVRDVLNILTDKTEDEINALPAEFLDVILTHLVFLATTPEVGEPTNKIVIDGEEYSINFMEKLKLGEYVAIDNVLKADKHDYASMLAILCRKKDEIYDSKFEAEVFEKRKEMFEKQPVMKILPIISFFLNLYIASERLSHMYSAVEEGISHIQQNIESLEKIGVFKKLSLNWQMKKLKKSLRSIKST
ncbi:hypothetical protein [uncultured Methanobrevibacter sp.]|uniref:hypothetical protein n=1 Tax=uncultured Methanobrevibacter sp. TaxID=253161 RepID=UPI0025D5AA99|nr:hypothetical protein [uncultured Methanobrevibacter sp.]